MPRALRLRLELHEVRPQVWRRILVPLPLDYWDLHMAIQDTMGWTDRYVHFMNTFTRSRERVHLGIPHRWFPWPIRPSWRHPVEADALEAGAKIGYSYGHKWYLTVTVEAVLDLPAGSPLPCCLEGQHASPPEELYGRPAYRTLRDALLDPTTEEHRPYLQWLRAKGLTEFDPEAFGPRQIRYGDPRQRLYATGLLQGWKPYPLPKG